MPRVSVRDDATKVLWRTPVCAESVVSACQRWLKTVWMFCTSCHARSHPHVPHAQECLHRFCSACIEECLRKSYVHDGTARHSLVMDVHLCIPSLHNHTHNHDSSPSHTCIEIAPPHPFTFPSTPSLTHSRAARTRVLCAASTTPAAARSAPTPSTPPSSRASRPPWTGSTNSRCVRACVNTHPMPYTARCVVTRLCPPTLMLTLIHLALPPSACPTRRTRVC